MPSPVRRQQSPGCARAPSPVFKDPRQLEEYTCCAGMEELDNFTFIDNEVKNRLTELKIKYYRQLHMTNLPNTQEYV